MALGNFMSDVWIPLLLGLMSANSFENYNHINYLDAYKKYYKYGSDE